jgi:predicted transcriptional regulator
VASRIRELNGRPIMIRVDAATNARLERIAPTVYGRRAAFVRRAILRELDRVEAEERAVRKGAG